MAFLDTPYKKKSTAITAVILIALLWMIFNFGMKYQDPPEEYGIAINFGISNQEYEIPNDILPVKESSEQVQEEVQEEKMKETTDDISGETIKEEVVTQTEKEAPVIEKPEEVELKEIKKKEKPKKEKPIPKPKKPSKNTLQAFDNLLKGDTSDENKAGEGNDTSSGLKGDKNGDPSSTKYYGNSGSSGESNYNLAGRNALSKPIEQPNCEEEGTVVVSIEVDKYGTVLKAVSGVKGTTNSANCLLKPAKEAALRTTWNADPNAPNKQKGTIIYKFSLTK
ncbi:energy transducer TonB [Flavobacteriaceae bacterium]|nr:energy transducer TonB [Flavobacteriaceae bacterium]